MSCRSMVKEMVVNVLRKSNAAICRTYRHILHVVKGPVSSSNDMECFDSNSLECHYFMALLRAVVESKIEDPRGRLTRLIKYTVTDARDLIKHCIQ